MRFETQRLVIRSFEPGDAAAILEMERDHDHALWAVERTDSGYGLTGLKKYVADRTTWAAPA